MSCDHQYLIQCSGRTDRGHAGTRFHLFYADQYGLSAPRQFPVGKERPKAPRQRHRLAKGIRTRLTMSIHADLKKLRTGAGDLRKFGLTVGGVFIFLGVLLLLRHRSSYLPFCGAGALLAAFGVTWPRSLKYIYI